jgi:hypothetical protein
VAVDGQGDVFIADLGNGRVVEVKADGTQTTVGSGLSTPDGVAVDAAGDVFIADAFNNRVVEVSAGLPVSVGPATPTVSVNPVPLTYGTALANGQLSGTATWTVGGNSATVAGTFTYTSAAGTVLNAGAGQSVAVTFTPSDSTDYTTVSTTVTVNVAQATPVVSVNPVPLIYGTPLANSQLSGTATWTVNGQAISVPGTFSYASPGTVLNAGTGQSVAVTFTPTDSTDYATASGTVSVTVAPAATTTSAVTLSSVTAVYGQPVTLSATVSNTQTAATPAGTVGFYSGATEVGTAAVGPGGIATLTVSTLSLGKHALTASYSDPAVNFAPSASPAPVYVTIGKAGTSTALAASTATPVFGQAVTFTATVAAVAPSIATPTGSVTFRDGSTTLATVSLSGGAASFTTSKVAVGGHSITATYNGTFSFTASGPATSAVSVSPDTTTAVVTSSVASPVYGQAVTLTARVKAAAPGAGTPTGTVSFYDGPMFLGSAPLSNGVANFKTTALSVGPNSITVVYGGDNNFQGTSAPLALTVNLDPTTTKLTSSSASAAHGKPVTLTASVLPVAPGSGAPTGTVSFWDGSALLGTVNLSGGVAQLTWSFSVVGRHKIKAVYNGDADFLVSTSAVLIQTIT